MKNATALLALTLGLSTLLVACGNGDTTASGSASSVESTTAESTAASESTAAEAVESKFSVDDIYAHNTLENLLSTHSDISVSWTISDGQGNVSSTTESVFIKDGDNLQMSSVSSDEVNGAYYSEYYKDDTCAGALYSYADDGSKYLGTYPDADYNALVSYAWINDNNGDVTVTIDSASEQDGAYVITTLTTYSNGGMYLRDMYYLDPETGDLLFRENQLFLLDDGETVPNVAYGEDAANAVSVTSYSISYDTGAVIDDTARTAVTDVSNGYTELNVIYDPQGDNMEVQQFSVSKDTSVLVTALNSTVTLYSDETLTTEIDQETETFIDISPDAVNVFAVVTPIA